MAGMGLGHIFYAPDHSISVGQADIFGASVGFRAYLFLGRDSGILGIFWMPWPPLPYGCMQGQLPGFYIMIQFMPARIAPMMPA